jgi:predicted phosphodiesterase
MRNRLELTRTRSGPDSSSPEEAGAVDRRRWTVPGRRSLRPGLAAAGTLALAIAGLALGLRLAGAAEHSTALGDVRLHVAPALRGEVDAYIPIADWGLRSHAFRGPFTVHAELRSVNRSGVLLAAAGERAILDEATADAQAAVGATLRRAVMFAVGGAALVGATTALVLLARGRRRGVALRVLALVTLLGAAIAGTSLVVARSTFDAAAFAEPRFYARGRELLQLLDAASRAERTAERYRAKVQGSLQAFSNLLAGGRVGMEWFPAVRGGRRFLVMSDLHMNRLVVEPVRALAAGQPVFFVGDFGHEGNEGEARLIAPALRRLGPQVVAVSGNHDSSRLMRDLVRAGVTVLTAHGRLRRDGSSAGPAIINAAGLRVAGFPDPLEWPGDDPADPRRVFGFEQMPEPERARRQAEASLVRWFDGLPDRPDIVLVHQNGLAQQLAATLNARGGQRTLIILTGHDHRQHVTRHGDVVVVDAGSVGAGGVLGVTDERVALGDLRFDPLEPTLQSVDLIEVDPFSGAGQAERVIVAGRRCADERSECRLSSR